jgi:hypothetical protein
MSMVEKLAVAASVILVAFYGLFLFEMERRSYGIQLQYADAMKRHAASLNKQASSQAAGVFSVRARRAARAHRSESFLPRTTTTRNRSTISLRRGFPTASSQLQPLFDQLSPATLNKIPSVPEVKRLSIARTVKQGYQACLKLLENCPDFRTGN